MLAANRVTHPREVFRTVGAVHVHKLTTEQIDGRLNGGRKRQKTFLCMYVPAEFLQAICMPLYNLLTSTITDETMVPNT